VRASSIVVVVFVGAFASCDRDGCAARQDPACAVGADLDGDGVGRLNPDFRCECAPDEIDCNDADDGVFPGADDVVGDGVDQDCDGVDGIAPLPPGSDPCALDEDGDGAPAASIVDDPRCDEADPALLDCDDRDTRRFPGADDVVGDGLDHDCDGRD
jgi:hypothetical protein